MKPLKLKSSDRIKPDKTYLLVLTGEGVTYNRLFTQRDINVNEYKIMKEKGHLKEIKGSELLRGVSYDRTKEVGCPNCTWTPEESYSQFEHCPRCGASLEG